MNWLTSKLLGCFAAIQPRKFWSDPVAVDGLTRHVHTLPFYTFLFPWPADTHGSIFTCYGSFDTNLSWSVLFLGECIQNWPKCTFEQKPALFSVLCTVWTYLKSTVHITALKEEEKESNNHRKSWVRSVSHLIFLSFNLWGWAASAFCHHLSTDSLQSMYLFCS